MPVPMLMKRVPLPRAAALYVLLGAGMGLPLAPPLVAPLRAQSEPLAPKPGAAVLPQTGLRVQPSSGGLLLQLDPPGRELLPANGRVRLSLREVGGAVLQEKEFRFPAQGAMLALAVPLQASPGRYEAQWVVLDKKERRALTAPAPFVVPGLRREAGTWFFDGGVYVRRGVPASGLAPATFVVGLTRASKVKLPYNVPAPVPGTTTGATGEATSWRTLDFPALTTMLAPNYDFAALEADMKQRLRRATGVHVGFAVPARSGAQDMAVITDTALTTIGRVRAIMERLAPGSALIFEVEVGAREENSARDLLAAGDLADAVVLHYPEGAGNLWPLKVARRIAEEQPAYDLPILLSAPRATPEFELLCLMSGATGVITANVQPGPAAEFVSKNLTLLAGAVTLEDAAIVPPPSSGVRSLEAALRAGGRLPLLGKVSTDPKAIPESVFAPLEAGSSLTQLEGLKSMATRGATIYLEGLPDINQPALLTMLEDLSGTTITKLAQPVSNQLAMEDPWTFGSARGRELAVVQSVTLTIRPSLAAQTKTEKGLDKLTAPRWVARLADDPGGLVVYAVGRGRVFWNPHRVLDSNNPSALAQYYGALAGAMQASLIKLGEPGMELSVPESSQVKPQIALRQSAGKTALLAVFNPGATAQEATVRFRGLPGLVINLNSGKELPFTVRGYETRVKVGLPAGGWTVLALPANRQALDKELSTPRLSAKLG